MDVLVTGSDGFIGTHLTERLRKEGHVVEEFDINSRPQKDVSNYETVYSSVDRNDYVFHLAAVADVWKTDREKLFNSNVLGVRNIEKAATETQTPVIFTSSVTAGEPTNLYAETKLIGERIFQGAPSDVLSWVRLSNVVGPKTTKGQVAAMVEQGVNEGEIEVWGDGEIMRSYVSVETVCSELISSLVRYEKTGDSKSGFIGEIGSQTMTNLEVANLISEYANADISCVEKMPPSPEKLIVEDIDGEDVSHSIEQLVEWYKTLE